MNEEEKKKKELEIARLEKIIIKKQKELDEEMIEPIKPMPQKIPIESHDMDYQFTPPYPQQSYPPQPTQPQQPRFSLPFVKSKQPRYVPQQQPNPSDNITKAQAAYEVAGQLDGKRTMAMAGIIEAIIVLALAMFNISYGFAGATVFCFYWMFQLWRLLNKRTYLRNNYGV